MTPPTPRIAKFECPHCLHYIDLPADELAATAEAAVARLIDLLTKLRPADDLPARIERLICDRYQIDPALLRSRARHRRLNQARQRAIWLQHQKGMTPNEIADRWGYTKNNILHAVRSVDNERSISPATREELDACTS